MSRKRTVLLLAVAALIAIPWALDDIFATTCTASASADSNFSNSIGSICGGSWSDTLVADTVEECLEEASVSSVYKLAHKWDFNNVAAGALTLTFTARETCGANDTFQYYWNTDPNKIIFQAISGAVVSDCNSQTVSAAMGVNQITGYIGVLLQDSNRSGDTQQDSAYIDSMQITTSPSDTCAEGETIGPGRIVSGSLGNLCAADSSREELEETTSSGKAKLKDVYEFDYVPQGTHTLCIKGYRTDGGGGDNFQFGFRVGSPGLIYQSIDGALISSSTESSACYSFASTSTNGDIFVAVWDTVGNDTAFNDLYLDQVVIHTDPICP